MGKTIVLAALALATSPVAAMGAESDRVDVAFEAMSQGRTAEAVARLSALSAEERADPAVLINLGTAYARQGKYAEAEALFAAAINSDTRYELELADGSWVDSREAARMALARLKKQHAIAMR